CHAIFGHCALVAQKNGNSVGPGVQLLVRQGTAGRLQRKFRRIEARVLFEQLLRAPLLRIRRGGAIPLLESGFLFGRQERERTQASMRRLREARQNRLQVTEHSPDRVAVEQASSKYHLEGKLRAAVRGQGKRRVG